MLFVATKSRIKIKKWDFSHHNIDMCNLINSSAYHARNSIFFLIKEVNTGGMVGKQPDQQDTKKKGLLGLFPLCLHCVCVRSRHISGDLAGQTVQTLFMPTISPACTLTHIMLRNTEYIYIYIFFFFFLSGQLKNINKNVTIFYKIQVTFARAKITVTMLGCL